MSLTAVKKRWSSPERLTIVGLVIALVFTVTGFEVASASIPDNNGEIHGCYTNTSPHVLRVINLATTPTCPSGTTSLKWNQVNVTEGFHDASQSFTNAGTVVGSLSLAAGSYSVTAKVNVHNGSAGGADDTCTLVAGAFGDAGEINVVMGVNTTIPLETIATFSSAGTVSVTCTDVLPSGSQSVNDVRIIATEATSVSGVPV